MRRLCSVMSLGFFLALANSCGGGSGKANLSDLPLGDQQVADNPGGDTFDPGPSQDIPWRDEGGDTNEEIVQGGFMYPCSTNGDCTSGFCVEGPAGNICTRTCIGESCPSDFVCSGIVNTFPDTTFICIPKFGKVCQPCTTDNQCAGGTCVTMPDGKFCSVACSANECPSPYTCIPQGTSGGSFCLPPSGTCTCRAADVGIKRLCQIKNDFGTCYGYEQCDATLGFVGCDARTPAAETCNGIDDDCNGTPDDNVKVGDPCDKTNEFGTCKGVTQCLGPQGLTCTALTPAAETCNGIDDNCDGFVDEPFKVNGVYATLENCGACNRSCVGLFPNSTPACDVTGVAPRCIVTACDNGFFKLNEFQCVPLSSLICTPCVVDTDCLRAGARCIPIGTDGGSYCGQSCTLDTDCPFSFHCLPAAGGANQCQPDSVIMPQTGRDAAAVTAVADSIEVFPATHNAVSQFFGMSLP